MDWRGYLRLPETMHRYDIVDGVLKYMEPQPDWARQHLLRTAFTALDGHVTRCCLGELVFAPLDVIISKGPLRVRQPDLLFISRERLGIVHHQVHGGPDLVVEILSPGNACRHVQQKLEDYASAGVREAWIIDPKGRSVTVFHLEKNALREAAVGRAPALPSAVPPRPAGGPPVQLAGGVSRRRNTSIDGDGKRIPSAAKRA